MQTQAHTANRAARRAKVKAKPAPVRKDATGWARTLENCRPFEPGEMLHEHIKNRTAYDNLRHGEGTQADFDRVAMMLNVGLVRSESIDALLVQTMQRGQDAMCRMKDRALRGLPFGFDAAGLSDVPVALDAFEAILDASSPQQMQTAVQVVWHRMFNKDVYEAAQ